MKVTVCKHQQHEDDALRTHEIHNIDFLLFSTANGINGGDRVMGDPLLDSSPLISAASSGKLRLLRLLVEGGAQVNGRNPRGETALLAACKALRGEPSGPGTLKLLTYLLRNKADPNIQDQWGRTALMYACMERAGPQVASALLSAGADPSMEDRAGASALVYAINAQHRPTLEVLMDACRARGRDIIIIATELDVNWGLVTRRYLNVPPPPNIWPASCMTPSDIVLKSGSPCSPGRDHIFNFRGTRSSSRHPSNEPSPQSHCQAPSPAHRASPEPRPAVHNQTCLNRAEEEEGARKGREEEEEGEEGGGRGEDLRRLADVGVDDEDEKSHLHELRKVGQDRAHWSHLRRNTLPAITVAPPPLHLPPLGAEPHLQVPARTGLLKSRSMACLPRPPSSSSSSSSGRSGLLPPLPLPLPLHSPQASDGGEKSRRSRRRHSVQLEQMRGGGTKDLELSVRQNNDIIHLW